MTLQESECRKSVTLRRRSHAAVEANTGNIPSWLPSFESSCGDNASEQGKKRVEMQAHVSSWREMMDDAFAAGAGLSGAQAHAAR